MGHTVKGLAILGSTGSIGTQTLDIVRTFPDRFRVVGLAARKSFDVLESQVREFRPKLVSYEGGHAHTAALRDLGCRACSLDDMVLDPDVQMAVTATVGDVALGPTITALKAGKDVALANKESIVMAGEYLTKLARKHNATLLPLDSEPNAIWQCMRGEDRKIDRLIITASGGAMRHASLEELATVTPERALKHPTWKMGPKITIDSATLMNKAFEVIEARWLFDVPWERIEVVIHPQSIIHSMVEFEDGSVKAQLSPPDMRLPIQYALFYPKRVRNTKLQRFDPVKTGALTFERMQPERYPCFELAMEYGRRGGTWPAVLCGADEAAVSAFLGGRLGFLGMAPVIMKALEAHKSVADPTPEQSLQAAKWASERVTSLVA
ncbi:MAG: 1-deoxy-D-xylulose-5-phosphate reductoisomerase [SAR202 cluster bacterium]|nr:1-deoxy-D-xylulose-5-phosphate reductoisomerase [SAR202 cluster bacterium]